MASTKPIVLILGAGPGVGAHCARQFAAKGYNVALAARSFPSKPVERGQLELQLDLARPEMVAEIFQEAREELGIPNVVIYNGKSLVPS